jgi:hypothetical protein
MVSIVGQMKDIVRGSPFEIEMLSTGHLTETFSACCSRSDHGNQELLDWSFGRAQPRLQVEGPEVFGVQTILNRTGRQTAIK